MRSMRHVSTEMQVVSANATPVMPHGGGEGPRVELAAYMRILAGQGVKERFQ